MTPATERTAVCVWLLMFLTVKTVVNVLAEGTVPKARASVSTSPLAISVGVPGWTAVPGVTRK